MAVEFHVYSILGIATLGKALLAMTDLICAEKAANSLPFSYVLAYMLRSTLTNCSMKPHTGGSSHLS